MNGLFQAKKKLKVNLVKKKNHNSDPESFIPKSDMELNANDYDAQIQKALKDPDFLKHLKTGYLPDDPPNEIANNVIPTSEPSFVYNSDEETDSDLDAKVFEDFRMSTLNDYYSLNALERPYEFFISLDTTSHFLLKLNPLDHSLKILEHSTKYLCNVPVGFGYLKDNPKYLVCGISEPFHEEASLGKFDLLIMMQKKCLYTCFEMDLNNPEELKYKCTLYSETLYKNVSVKNK